MFEPKQVSRKLGSLDIHPGAQNLSFPARTAWIGGWNNWWIHMLIDLTIPNINTTNLMQANFTSYNEFQTGKLHDSNSDAQKDKNPTNH